MMTSNRGQNDRINYLYIMYNMKILVLYRASANLNLQVNIVEY